MDHFKTSSSSMGDSSSQSSGNEEDNNNHMFSDLRRGPWTVEEDFTLMNYISLHGEGRWNSLANSAGLKRTGKSCRLRWLNYLRPDVRRGNITLEEQLLILDLHSRWGNRWSKIAQYLPGRTDNEIKNYWRTRVQKHAKQLKCDVNSKQFKDTMRYLWMPRLVERIQAAATTTTTTTATTLSATTSTSNYHLDPQNHHNIDMGVVNQLDFSQQNNLVSTTSNNYGNIIQVNNQNNFTTPENSSTGGGGSTDSFGMTQQVISPISELSDCYNNHEFYQPNQFSTCDNSFNQGFNQGFDYLVDHNNQWMDSGNISDCLWNMDDAWFLQQELNIL